MRGRRGLNIFVMVHIEIKIAFIFFVGFLVLEHIHNQICNVESLYLGNFSVFCYLLIFFIASWIKLIRRKQNSLDNFHREKATVYHVTSLRYDSRKTSDENKDVWTLFVKTVLQSVFLSQQITLK